MIQLHLVNKNDEHNNKYKECISNTNLPIGIKMYTKLFSEDQLDNIENIINNYYGWNFKQEKKHHHFPEYKFIDGIKNISYGMCAREPVTGICKLCNCHMNINTINNLPIPNWIQNIIIKKLVNNGIIPNGWANCATIIMYKDPTLKAHFDSPHVFDLPIVTLRLFSKTILSIDSSKKYIDNGNLLQKRGYVTLLSGDAATKWDHAINKYENDFAVSIVIRRIHPELVGENWMKENCKFFTNTQNTKRI
jgi:hypothetical protein